MAHPAAAGRAEKTEWAFARLMYPQAPGGRGGFGCGRFRGRGLARRQQHLDAGLSARRPAFLAGRPAADAHPRALRRAAGQSGRGRRSTTGPGSTPCRPGAGTDRRPGQAMREYLLRGGFFMADDFWGEDEWETFMASMQQGLPGPESVELANPTPSSTPSTIWTTAIRWPAKAPCSAGAVRSAGLSGPLARHLRRPWPPDGGHHVPVRRGRFLGVGGRTHYPEKYSALGIRIGVNYIVYAMTH